MRQRFEEEARSDEAPDEIWCVLDHHERDAQIAEFRSSIAKVQARRPRDRIAVSKPCFEYWLLLHFEYITRAFHGVPGRSACCQVTEVLQGHLPNYRKNDQAIFRSVSNRTARAIANAKQGMNAGAPSFTEVGLLVERLETLRAPRPKSPAGRP